MKIGILKGAARVTKKTVTTLGILTRMEKSGNKLPKTNSGLSSYKLAVLFAP